MYGNCQITPWHLPSRSRSWVARKRGQPPPSHHVLLEERQQLTAAARSSGLSQRAVQISWQHKQQQPENAHSFARDAPTPHQEGKITTSVTIITLSSISQWLREILHIEYRYKLSRRLVCPTNIVQHVYSDVCVRGACLLRFSKQLWRELLG